MAFQKKQPAQRQSTCCRNCGAPLKTHRERQETFCSSFRCRPASLAYMQKHAQELRQRETEARDTYAKEVLEDLKQQKQVTLLPDTEAVVMIVPDNPRQVIPQPTEHIAEFRHHLESIMRQAEEQIKDADSHESLQVEHESRSIQQQTSLPVINACTSCRGACCLQAKGHAFLNKDFFAWRLLNENDTSPDEKIADYLSRIPTEAYEGSCVYHGREGCVLPREIRSSTCNGFLCTGILDGQRRDQKKNSVASIAIVNSGDERRVGLLDTNGHRTEASIGNSRPE